LVAYVHNANIILALPISNRSEKSLLAVITALYEKLAVSGLFPTIHICDNEYPAAVKKYHHLQNATINLVPPHNHRTNPAEHSIDVFKTHFLALLSSADPAFPMHLWCRLVPHAVITLNLL